MDTPLSTVTLVPSQTFFPIITGASGVVRGTRVPVSISNQCGIVHLTKVRGNFGDVVSQCSLSVLCYVSSLLGFLFKRQITLGSKVPNLSPGGRIGTPFRFSLVIAFKGRRTIGCPQSLPCVPVRSPGYSSMCRANYSSSSLGTRNSFRSLYWPPLISRSSSGAPTISPFFSTSLLGKMSGSLPS